jgi:hypothetical protein
MRLLLVLLALASAPAFSQAPPPRDNTNDISVHLLILGTGHYRFENGVDMRNDGGGGIGASVARNLNNHIAVGADLTFSAFGTRSHVTPGTDNPHGAFDVDGDVEMAAIRLHATWYLLSGPVTPFITGGVGANYVNPTFDSHPPVNDRCWNYPMYGEVCRDTSPTRPLLRLGYGAGAGVRVDLPRRQGFLRLMASGEWIEFSEATSTVGYVQVRADFGIAF